MGDGRWEIGELKRGDGEFGELTRALDNQPNSTPPHVLDGMVMVRVMMM